MSVSLHFCHSVFISKIFSSWDQQRDIRNKLYWIRIIYIFRVIQSSIAVDWVHDKGEHSPDICCFALRGGTQLHKLKVVWAEADVERGAAGCCSKERKRNYYCTILFHLPLRPLNFEYFLRTIIISTLHPTIIFWNLALSPTFPRLNIFYTWGKETYFFTLNGCSK